MMRLVPGLLACLCGLGLANAQGISDQARKAEAFANQGKFTEAINALDESAAELWEKTPLTFRRALWVAENPTGYGGYNPRETATFSSGAEMIAYAEPIGFGWRKSGDIWRTDLIADLSIQSKEGTELLRKDDFERLQVGSRVRNREFMARFTYTLTGIPKGEYALSTTLRDAVTGKSGSFSLPFVIQ